MMKTNKKNKQNYQMLLFCKETGLSIEYDEDNNTFQFQELLVCHDIAPFYSYAYVRINDIILFFGGLDFFAVSKAVHIPLRNCVAILTEENNDVHIIGGVKDKDIKISTHMKTKVRIWDPSQLVIICLFSKNEIKFIIQYWIRTLQIRFGWIYDFNQLIMKYSK
ncbi:hypothetical protein RFI_31573 [Reticulomyxa filosa]|uniref:Uncharacterized protein n=1 Tax=Reticulomyxa filosa TaxID=46433 RepID=X6LXF6_RETFI|nr:hypothetical protein RFI_31573 [Reticulomyxa filosa]|eukprot:ETO05822.1 hypothetical protein RFI_31573 [Reticulomyxa filosa]